MEKEFSFCFLFFKILAQRIFVAQVWEINTNDKCVQDILLLLTLNFNSSKKNMISMFKRCSAYKQKFLFFCIKTESLNMHWNNNVI